MGILGWKSRQIVDYEPTGNEQALSGELDWQYDDPTYPGTFTEIYHADAENYQTFTFAVGSVKDLIDYEIGGMPGDTKWVGSTGVVEPTNVDAHDFDGGMAIIRRQEVNMAGPVQTSDHNSLLALLYLNQETNSYFPNEVSQAEVIKGV